MKFSILYALSALSALSALQSHVALAQDIPTCVPACSNQVRGKFASFTCASADDAACLCSAPDFFYGVRDCAPSCGATDVQVFNYLAASFCQGHALPVAPSSTPTADAPSASPAPTEAAPVSTAPAISTPTESSTSTTPATGISTDSMTTAAASSSTAAATPPSTTDTSTSSPAVSESAVPTALSSEIPVKAAATTTSSSSTGLETSAVSDPSSAPGLSQGAVIGIGVGVGVGVLAIAVIALLILLKHRRAAPRQSIKISGSSPRNGRAHPGGTDHGPFEKYANDIEMVSNRYEDMVPRAAPRTMV